MVRRRLRDDRLAGGKALARGTGARSAHRCDAKRMNRGAFFNSVEAAGDVAARDGLRQGQVVPAAINKPTVDMADLVARAFAVLDQGKMTSDAQYREGNVAAKSPTRSIGLEP